MVLVFDGENKTIVVGAGTTTLSATEVYSDWKEWVLDNPQYPAAFRTFGGDPTVTGQYAPSYFFLTNGWRLIMDNLDIIFEGNLYTDEGDTPFINNFSNITHTKSDAVAVATGTGLSEAQQSELKQSVLFSLLNNIK